ncbi:hypothetical protein E2C01_042604 [Portunus trituberculatus]|uniref:Uncharacterized protein n=1 Tax=Portunus trituberculatus TaxID=210409 RepID=A0A5B7FM91_PORTR|nr:hypothetical protein [Portunus trituberculatus]
MGMQRPSLFRSSSESPLLLRRLGAICALGDKAFIFIVDLGTASVTRISNLDVGFFTASVLRR